MSLATYTVNTVTPGAGSQTVSKINNSLYFGSTGPFDSVVMSYDGTTWQFVIYMTSDPNSPFHPSKTFEQVTSDPNPIANYEMLVNGVKDPNAGTGSVTI